VGCVGDLIDPIRWGSPARFFFTNLVSYDRFVTSGSRVPRDTVNDEVPI
jgi:hypothetical protein